MRCACVGREALAECSCGGAAVVHDVDRACSGAWEIVMGVNRMYLRHACLSAMQLV